MTIPTDLTDAQPIPSAATSPRFLIGIVGAVAFAHLLNDLIQAVLPAIYPMLKTKFALSFTQIGLVALVYQFTASLLQPWIGFYTDKHPKPYLLPCGMFATLIGIGLLDGRQLLHAPCRLGGDRGGVRHLPSGSLACGPSRLRRTVSAQRNRPSRSAATPGPPSGLWWPR